MTVFGSDILSPMTVGHESERAAGLAGWLAARIGAGLRLLSVVDNDSEAPARQTYLESVAASIASQFDVAPTCGISLSADIESELARALSAETGVVMATAATRRPHDGHFGSIADHIIQEAYRPVTLVGPQATARFSSGPSRVIVPVDGSRLAERAVPVGGSLAEILDLPMSIVTVMRRGSADHSPTFDQAYVRELARKLQATGLAVEPVVMHDQRPPEQVVVSLENGNVIPVIASHGRTGVKRLVAGSVAIAIVRSSKWPVMVVPPYM